MKTSIIIALTVVLLVGCTRPPKLTVVNGSTSTLTNIVASGSGFSAPFGSLAPGAQRQLTVNPQPRDNPGFKLEFDANGQRITEVSHDNSFDGMKEVIMTVTPKLTVTYQSVTTF